MDPRSSSTAVHGAKLGDSSVSDRTIVSDAVKTVHITDGNVTNEKLATGIDGQKINDGSLQGSAIVDDSDNFRQIRTAER